MDSLTTQFSGSLKMHRKRRRYQRLKHVVTAKKRVKVLRFHGGGGKPWKMRLMPKLRHFRITSPMKILERLRDAYVEMMLCLAGNVAQLNNGNVSLFRRIHRAPEISGWVMVGGLISISCKLIMGCHNHLLFVTFDLSLDLILLDL